MTMNEEDNPNNDFLIWFYSWCIGLSLNMEKMTNIV